MCNKKSFIYKDDLFKIIYFNDEKMIKSDLK